ncbi:MAG: spore coat protein [Clostridia bacterium]|nr:spore coat protein [Clostridia bacterium]MBQ6946810.1 spore coat protein [Clostridia bacterium]
MNLTQKETAFLNDFKTQEQLCIDKYTKYSTEACSSCLKNLFSTLAKAEQTHLDTINQILGGTAPQVKAAPSATGAVCNDNACYCDSQSQKIDKMLCQDMLAMEKHVSGVYNTGVFEFSDPLLRDALSHIQKEEQNHGEQLYSYMAANGMY